MFANYCTTSCCRFASTRTLLVVVTVILQFAESHVYIPTSRTNSIDELKVCPRDSFLNPSGDCECLPCESSEQCEGGMTLQIVRNGTNHPDMCCSLYQCVQSPSYSTPNCTKDGNIYLDNTTWSDKECSECRCSNGYITCYGTCGDDNVAPHYKNCLTQNGVLYKHNTTWNQDHCTICDCNDGDIKCIAHFCETKTMIVQKINCMQLTEDECSIKCPNGYKKTQMGCEICECRKHPSKVYEIFRSMNFSNEDDVDIIMKMIDAEKLSENEDNVYYKHLTVMLSFIILALIILCVFLFCLYRQSKLKRSKMHVYTTKEFNKYMNVPNYDANLNATYKYHSNECVK